MATQRISTVYEEEIERLKREVKSLIAKNQQTLVRNLDLENEVVKLRGALSRLSGTIESEVGFRKPEPKTAEGNASDNVAYQELKKNYNDLLLKYKSEASRFRAMEANYRATVRNSKEDRASAATEKAITYDPADKIRITELEKELDVAYDVIEELEFEMESVVHLEQENYRLEKELEELRAEKDNLAQGMAQMRVSEHRQSSLGAERRSVLMKKLEVMHSRHSELVDKARKELNEFEEE